MDKLILATADRVAVVAWFIYYQLGWLAGHVVGHPSQSKTCLDYFPSGLLTFSHFCPHSGRTKEQLNYFQLK